ncbi:mitochondrial substrate carrier family protein Y [Helianthus annuus]|nr:mitochondrial substrate carrier family protein Y [Helianthus annuus]
MSGGARSRTNSKPSINYKYNPHGGASFDVVDVTREDYAPSSHNNSKNPANQAEARSSVLSTAYVISGVGQLWNFATSTIPVRHRTTSAQNTAILQKENALNTLYFPAEEGNIVASISSEGHNVSVNLKADSDVSPNVQKDLDFIHVEKKLSCFSESRVYNYLLRCMHTDSGKTILSSGEKRVSSVLISDGLQDIYGWMNTVQISRPTYDAGETNNLERSDPDETTTSDNGMTSKNDVCYDRLAENKESLSNENMKSITEINTESWHEKEDALLETKEGQRSQFPNEESSVVHVFTSSSNKPQYGLAKQEHAFAGAFAGTFVSLCLHPMDTVKTVVQSCHTDQRSIPYISKSIISERGLSGLYRGIASNIASSAPISAIYTFSYESVKAALLPLFAKEYHSLAHCIAGGCASVATSFVFTPSERIKQQMQVGSHYRSCWNAFLGIVGKGGFLSLYNGWGAVLCRNVPHSIIKFYTYEGLKSVLLTSNDVHGQSTTISTLLCGGLAGSTAALFTTPFDVVKTRLQTQIPGSASRYNGVYNTLRDIAQHEGLQGLYRGLTPRLFMYMTQGALFFASYESFKRLLSLEATQLESASKCS